MNKQCSSCGGFCGKYCQRENIKPEQDYVSLHNVMHQAAWDVAIPVAEGDIRALNHRIHKLEGELIRYKKIVADERLMEMPKQEQGEPVCDECGVGGGYSLYCLSCAEKFFGNKEWVGLTEDEIYKIAFQLEGEHWKKIANAIEAKLKEKNT